jgi:hypothetical protein
LSPRIFEFSTSIHAAIACSFVGVISCIFNLLSHLTYYTLSSEYLYFINPVTVGEST